MASLLIKNRKEPVIFLRCVSLGVQFGPRGKVWCSPLLRENTSGSQLWYWTLPKTLRHLESADDVGGCWVALFWPES